MDFTTLKNKLPISNGTVTITTNTLTSNVNTLLTKCYANQTSIDISDAVYDTEDATTKTIIITGKSSYTYLGLTDVGVEATFQIDDTGDVQMTLIYTCLLYTSDAADD